MQYYCCFARRRKRGSGAPEIINLFNPILLCMGLFSHFLFGRRAYPAPARFFCQTRCTAQVQPGG